MIGGLVCGIAGYIVEDYMIILSIFGIFETEPDTKYMNTGSSGEISFHQFTAPGYICFMSY